MFLEISNILHWGYNHDFFICPIYFVQKLSYRHLVVLILNVRFKQFAHIHTACLNLLHI